MPVGDIELLHAPSRSPGALGVGGHQPWPRARRCRGDPRNSALRQRAVGGQPAARGLACQRRELHVAVRSAVPGMLSGSAHAWRRTACSVSPEAGPSAAIVDEQSAAKGALASASGRQQLRSSPARSSSDGALLAGSGAFDRRNPPAGPTAEPQATLRIDRPRPARATTPSQSTSWRMGSASRNSLAITIAAPSSTRIDCLGASVIASGSPPPRGGGIGEEGIAEPPSGVQRFPHP